MTQEEKQLLLADLCSRLPYGVKVEITILETNKVVVEQFDYMWLGILYSENPYHIIKPYLRPMSSMTEEEIIHCLALQKKTETTGEFTLYGSEYFDYLNSIYVDYRDLIGKGLALEAPSDMYK